MSSDAHIGDTSELAPLTDVPPERCEVFRNPRRIRVLEVLERGVRTPLPELTTEVLEREGTTPADGRCRHEVRVDLVHNHLPQLAAAGLVAWDVDAGAELVAEPPVRPAVLAPLLELDRDVDELVSEVVEPVRLRVLELVCDRPGPHSIDELASALASHDSAAPADEARAKVVLHHSHLPALSNVGLLEYDRESGLVEQPTN